MYLNWKSFTENIFYFPFNSLHTWHRKKSSQAKVNPQIKKSINQRCYCESVSKGLCNHSIITNELYCTPSFEALYSHFIYLILETITYPILNLAISLVLTLQHTGRDLQAWKHRELNLNSWLSFCKSAELLLHSHIDKATNIPPTRTN